MSTHDVKVQQSSCQSGVKASVTRAVTDQERFHTQTHKATRFQNVREQEKLNPAAASQHIHSKEDLETRNTASPSTLQLKGQQKSSRDLQIKQIILFGSKNTASTEQSQSARFTSTISIKLPTRRNKNDTTEEKTLHATTNFYRTLEVEKNAANQHHTELRDLFSTTEQCGESTGELLKDGQKATFDEVTQHQRGQNTPKHGQNTRIQHNIGLHEQTQTDHEDSVRHNSSHLIYELRTEVKKESGDFRENAPTTLQNQSNLDSVLKASPESRLFPYQSEVLDQVLSLACFPAYSDNTPEAKANLINPTTAMLTSALASVLAPPWSGRLRRPKQGINEAENEVQDLGQNGNPSTLIQQDRRQQPFLPFQRHPSEHMMANDSNMQVNAGTSYSADWQKENNSPNVTTTVNQKRPITKSSSVGMMYNNRELHSFPTTLDSRQMTNLPHSGYRMSKTRDENEPFKSLSSKPTTSSLLLSLRRSNLRNSTAEPTQTQTPITRSMRSLTLPSRIVLKTPSSDQSVSSEGQINKNPDTPVRTEGIPVGQFRFSPRVKSRVPLNTSMFSNKQETDISKGLEASVATAEVENEHFPHFPHSTTKTSQLGALRSHQTSYLVLLREYSSTENTDPMEQSPGNSNNLQSSNITKRQLIQNTVISPKDSTDFQIQQSNFHMSKSQSIHNITASNSSGTSTFTNRLNFSPRKDSSVDGVSPTNVGNIYSRKYSSQSSMDLTSPLSPSRPCIVRAPSIYSYLRESNSSLSSPSPSTPLSHIQNAETSPPKLTGGVTLHGDWKTLPSRFSFDFNPSVPKVQELHNRLSTNTAPAQSLPPDFGRGSAPRLSTSPYSSLISSRPALSSTLQERSSPPVSETHTRFTSYNNAELLKHDPSSLTSKYTSVTRRPREDSASSHRVQRTAVQAYASNLDNHRPAQPCLSQTTPDASFVMESRSANISSHPRQPDTGSNNFHNLEHDESMALQLDKGNVYPKHRLSEKEKYLLPKDLNAQGETPLAHEKETTAGHMHEGLQETQSPNSKKGLLASRVKKDGAFSSASLPDKEVGSSQFLKTKRHLPVFRTTSRIDQMLNRLKLTFGVKPSDSALDTVTKKNKTPTQQPSDTETFEIPKTDERTCSGNQLEPSNSSLKTDKASLGSLSPITLSTSERTLNVDGQNMSTVEKQYAGCMWEVPNASLTTNKATFESLSPLSAMKSENTLNMDWQNSSTKTNDEQNGSGWTWETSSTSLTTDKTYFASFGSSSSSKKSSDNKLNGDQQKMDSNEMDNQSNGRSFSQHRLKAQSMNRSATLPHYRKSSFGPPSPFSLFDFDSEDSQNDSVFYSPVSKKTNSLCESDDISPQSSAKSSLQQNLVRSRLSSSCADLKYGLHGGRSFSVSGVVSSRPSGSRRISTSSTSDLSSLEDFIPKGNQMVDSLTSTNHSPRYDAKSITGKEPQTEFTGDCPEHDFADPTPPPSPTFSSSPRRISQAHSTPSPIRTTPENLSPFHGTLPSRSYTNSLTVFEESGSDTTTDDEYYLDNRGEDDLETEL